MPRRFYPFVIYIFVFFLLISGCATTGYQRDENAMNNKNYEEAIKNLSLAHEKNPKDVKILENLGLAYYQNRDFEKSIEILQQVLDKEPENGKALFYIGTAYEITGDTDNAIEMYRRYNQVSKTSSLRRDLERRLRKLLYAKMQQEVIKAVKNEAAIDVSTIQNNTIAVVYFKYMGSDSNLIPLQKGLADLLITDLSKAEKLAVVERLKLQKCLEEIGLGMTGLVDAGTAPRVGKLLGTAKIVNGAYIDLADEQFRIDAGISEVKTEKFSGSMVTGDLNNFFKLEKDLVFEIINNMGITLTQEEIDNIRIVPTENLLAFIAYCNGLDYSDRGMMDEAGREFNKAVELDPGFEMARQKSEQFSDLGTELQPMSELVQLADNQLGQFTTPAPEAATTPPPAAEPEISAGQLTDTGFPNVPGAGTIPAPTLFDRLQNTGQFIDVGFIPGVESREPAQEQTQPTFGNTANIEIKVDIPNY
ncbi:tetratricopeptide repeat protein [candidate division KSB1 bacterium]|nr:tetratricopeptide repeat protein [candidate division KSB1 bacterium]